jgi:hypothetical protein
MFKSETITAMHPSYVRLLEQAVEITRHDDVPVRNHADLARKLIESAQTVHNWKTRGVSRDGAIKAAPIFGIPVQYVMEGVGPKRVAQSVSQDSARMPPQSDATKVEWETMDYDQLPDVFEVVIPDNAMADRVKKGYRVTFEKTRWPRADQGILVANAAGQWFFRSFIPLQGEHFKAAPLNKDYEPALDSEADGLTILGTRVSHTSDEEWG